MCFYFSFSENHFEFSQKEKTYSQNAYSINEYQLVEKLIGKDWFWNFWNGGVVYRDEYSSTWM